MISLFILCLFVSAAAAVIVSPPILVPSNTTVAYSGCELTVAWNTSVFYTIPGAAPLTGMIQLGYLLPNSTSEHLYWTLDTGVNLLAGSDTVTIPASIPAGDNYIIVVFGDSGNASPQFTIKQNLCCIMKKHGHHHHP